jgi:hypothetical protein
MFHIAEYTPPGSDDSGVSTRRSRGNERLDFDSKIYYDGRMAMTEEISLNR